MRLVLPLAVLALAACSPGGGGGDGERASAKQTQRAVTEVAEEAFPLTARALGAHRVGAHAEWFECLQGLSWKYSGGGAVFAPSGDVQARLQAVKASLLDAGFTESLTTDNQVSVERDGISFTVMRPATDQKNLWAVSFESHCGGYSDEDQALIDRDRGHDFEDLGH